jgi:anti-sigma regulatory factor (Ser/Thr protein kinase)
VALTFTARVPGELCYRDVVGAIVREVCRHVERVERCSGVEWRVVSAFNEAFNNVAEHAYGEGVRGEVVVVVRVEPARLVLELQDRGRGFDFGAVLARTDGGPPPLDTLDAGGMGLFLIRRAVTEVTYERGVPNRLTMVQDLAECAAAGAVPAAGPNDEGSRC